jgi:hypothetical protein
MKRDQFPEKTGLWSDHTNYQYKENREEKQEETGSFLKNFQQKGDKNRENPAEMRKTEPPSGGSEAGKRFWCSEETAPVVSAPLRRWRGRTGTGEVESSGCCGNTGKETEFRHGAGTLRFSYALSRAMAVWAALAASSV